MSDQRQTWRQEFEQKVQDVEHVRHDLIAGKNQIICSREVLRRAADMATDPEKEDFFRDLIDRLTPAIDTLDAVVIDFLDHFGFPTKPTRVP